MPNFNVRPATRERAAEEYENHMRDHAQGYYKSLESYNAKLMPLVNGSAFSSESWKKILERDDLYALAKKEATSMFLKGHNDETKARSFERLLDNTREITRMADIAGDSYSLEGWGGGNAVYASSLGAFAMGTTPFIIGGWLASARSQEIYQIIDNQNNMRLEFEYRIDYLQVGDEKYFFPKAFRSGEITGYNKLPAVDWVTPNTSAGTYTKPEDWCGEDMFIELNPKAGAESSVVKGNLLAVCKRNVHQFGIEPNCRFVAIKYKDGKGDGAVIRTKRIHCDYHIATGQTNERIFKSDITLKNLKDMSAPVVVRIYMKINLDTGDFILMSTAGESAEDNMLILGLKFDGKVSNIANELKNLPTMGVDTTQFVRECEYRNYSKVSLNEYMSDNFRIGTNNNISYAAYATDKNLQYTVFNRELEAEQFAENEVLDDSVDVDSFPLTHKMGGFINSNLSFTVNRFTPGLHLQDYKEGLKTYLTKVLAVAETDLNIPASVKREWIFLGYDALITEFPEIKFENAQVDIDANPQGAAKNENYGFAVDTRCGFIDSLGRGVRLIANNDSRWRDRGNSVFGCIRTYSMEYPFLVYYPHAIRMYTAIDADNPNRTAVYIGGREYRGVFAGGAVQLEMLGVLDDEGVPVNNFANQISDSKAGYTVIQNS